MRKHLLLHWRAFRGRHLRAVELIEVGIQIGRTETVLAMRAERDALSRQ